MLDLYFALKTKANKVIKVAEKAVEKTVEKKGENEVFFKNIKNV